MVNKLQDREGSFKSKEDDTKKEHETRFALLEQAIRPNDNHRYLPSLT
jgi:hypothetical protein